MAVLDREEVKAYLGISQDNQDARIDELILVAQSTIAERVGPLEPVAKTVRVFPSGRTLCVPSPAAEITSVTDADGTVLAIGDLHLEQRAGLITFNDGRCFSARWYDVAYNYGRASGQCPAHLVEAVLVLIKHLHNPQMGVGPRPGASVSDGAANTIPGAGYLLPNRCLELIAPERPQMVG